MALGLVQPGIEPLGQFDGYYLDVAGFVGGEVCTLIAVSTASQTGPADQADGYINAGSLVPAATKGQLTTALTTALYLADDGTSTIDSASNSVGYGTLFGQVVGGTVGQKQINSGTVLGPASQVGSGRITLWDKPGLYKVTLDACDQSATTGLQVTNSTLTTGAALYAMGGGGANPGFLTPNHALTTNVGYSSTTSQIVGAFVEFETTRALVTTPNRLVAALNSPSANPAVSLTQKMSFAVFKFMPDALVRS
jgi:hypothetical protein